MSKYQNEKILELAKDSASWLNSAQSLEMLKKDPYWPKWDSPWWRMHLLMETGYSHLIPKDFAQDFLKQFEKHYIHFFPTKIEQVPVGCDPVMQIVCHCALGSVIRMLTPVLQPDKPLLGWFSDWSQNYQIADGGYNCDEATYNCEKPVSSLISTLPMLEAMLLEVKLFGVSSHLPILQQGVEYYLARGLTGSSKDPKTPILAAWDIPTFPRFYEFDGQRVLGFLIDYHLHFGLLLPKSVTEYAKRLHSQIYSQPIDQRPFRTIYLGEFSRVLDANGEFVSGSSNTFPMLDCFASPEVAWSFLEAEYLGLAASPR
jgi:hypothetical protein